MSNAAETVLTNTARRDDGDIKGVTIRSALGKLSFSRISGVYVWLGLILIFALWVPNTFLTTETWQNIGSAQAVTAMVTLGLLLPLAAGIYDLAVGQTLGFAGILSAYLVTHGVATAPAVVLTLLAGVMIGVANGVLVVSIGINSFIATLGVGSVLLALTEALSNDEQIVGLPSAFQKIGAAQPGGIPVPILYLLALSILVWYLLEHSPFGRYLYALGGGREAARLAGVQTKRLGYAALIGSSLVAAFAGIVVTGKIGAGDPTVGPSYLLPAYAIAFLGATQIKPGRFNAVGALIAAYLLGTGVTGLQLAGASFWVTDLFNGLVLIVALVLARVTFRGQARRLRLASLRRSR